MRQALLPALGTDASIDRTEFFTFVELASGLEIKNKKILKNCKYIYIYISTVFFLLRENGES